MNIYEPKATCLVWNWIADTIIEMGHDSGSIRSDILNFNYLRLKIIQLVDKILCFLSLSYQERRTELSNRIILVDEIEDGAIAEEVGPFHSETHEDTSLEEFPLDFEEEECLGGETSALTSYQPKNYLSQQSRDIQRLILSFLPSIEKVILKSVSKEMAVHADYSIQKMNQCDEILIEKQARMNRDFLLKHFHIFRIGTYCEEGIEGTVVVNRHGHIVALWGADTGYVSVDHAKNILQTHLQFPSSLPGPSFSFCLNYEWNPEADLEGPVTLQCGKGASIFVTPRQEQVIQKTIQYLNREAFKAWKETIHPDEMKVFLGPAWFSCFIRSSEDSYSTKTKALSFDMASLSGTGMTSTSRLCRARSFSK